MNNSSSNTQATKNCIPSAINESIHATIIEKSDAMRDWEYRAVSPDQFARSIFGNLERPFIALVQKGMANKRMHIFEDWHAVNKLAQTRPDIYMPYVGFSCPSFRKALARTLYAFCVDLDNVSVDDAHMLAWKIHGMGVKPTFVVNSGNGFHAIYALKTPLELNWKHHMELKSTYSAIKRIYKHIEGVCWKVDSIWWGQSFRVAGGMNKHGTTTEIFRTGPKYELANLAHQLRIELGEASQRRHPVHPRTQHKPHQRHIATLGIAALPTIPCTGNLSDSYYNRCLNIVRQNVKRGGRFNAMLGLAGVARRPTHHPADLVSEWQLRHDLQGLQAMWNTQTPAAPITGDEIDKALAFYRSQATGRRITRQKLADWFGFEPPAARHKPKRSKAKQREETRQLIEQGINMLKGASTKVTAKALADSLGLSRQTVQRHIKVRKGVVEWR